MPDVIIFYIICQVWLWYQLKRSSPCLVFQLRALSQGYHTNLFRICQRDVTTCYRFYNESIQTFVSCTRGGKDAPPLHELQNLIISIQRCGYVDMTSLQIFVVDQTTWSIWSIHCSFTQEGEFPMQTYNCLALLKLKVSASGHCSNHTILSGCLSSWKFKELGG